MIKYLFLFLGTLAFSQNIRTSEMISKDYENVKKRLKANDEEAINQLPEQVKRKYERVEKFLPYNNSLFLVIQNNKKGIIDMNGTIIVPVDHQFIEAHTYETDIAGKYEVYMIGYSNTTDVQKYYSKQGSLIAESYSPFSPSIENGQIIKIGTKDGKIQLFNIPTGKLINNKKYDKAREVFVNGKMKVERNGNNYLVNQSGLETKIN